MQRAVLWLVLTAMVPCVGSAAEKVQGKFVVSQSEVFVPQMRGRIPARSIADPLSRSQKGKAPVSADNAARQPVNCTPANASSPECYSATQQSRSPAR